MTEATESSIPLVRPWFGSAEELAVAEVVRSGWVAQGPRVQEFEAAFAHRVGAQHAVATSSCTTALHLALVLLGAGPGDEIVVPSLSFIATANVVRYVGASPVFADVDEVSQNLTAATIEAVLTPTTRAVILVHQAGMPADVEAIHRVCDRRGIAVVEDAACAIGSTYRGDLIGTGSDLVAFSFHPRKLVTAGEGGMLVTSDADWASRARRLREHGMDISAAERLQSKTVVLEHYHETGFNFRMTDVQAALGLVQLERLDEMIARRRSLAARYHGLLGDLALGLPHDPPYGTTNFQSFCVALEAEAPFTRDELRTELQRHGIASARGIMAAHLEPAYAELAHAPLPVTERVTANSVILPLFHQMTDAEQERVVAVVRGCFEGPPTRRRG